MLLNKQQAREIIPVSQSGLDRMIRRNEIPFVRIGKRIFFEAELLEDYLTTQRNEVAVYLSKQKKLDTVNIGVNYTKIPKDD